MKRALLSVSDKKGIVKFAKQLVKLDYEIISTGGTYKKLRGNDIPVTAVDSITNFPEILEGRVKTLHPMIHGGLLAKRSNKEHMEAIKSLNISPIDIVCVNLYPFEATIKKEDVSFDEAIENIDIGGPTMLRSAAKNYQDVAVICDSNDYDTVIQELTINNAISLDTKKQLSAKVFRHTAYYDALIANYFTPDLFPEKLTKGFRFNAALRYGENPHQKAAYYQLNDNPYSLFNAEQLNGKALSYNNIQDANAAINILKEHNDPTVVGLKHMNPCGVASNSDLLQATQAALESDPVSIFGGIIAMNRPLTLDIAKTLSKIFLEIIIAPFFDPEALGHLKKKKNLRILKLDTTSLNTDQFQITSINGGVLFQEIDNYIVDKKNLEVVTRLEPSDAELDDLLFSWKVVKHVKSNAIVVTKGSKTVGIGAGQMNRVGAAKIALEWAKKYGHTENLTLASDAFFPFDDVVKLAAKYGVKSIIQPGGSIRDQESINACNNLGIKMVFTKNRHFKH